MVNETPNQERLVERYSFSKLSSWWTCPYGYFLRYIEHKAGIGNAFASYGTLVHEIMEKYAKGEAELWDLPQMFEWLFDSAVQEKFPPNKYADLRESYYKQGLDFLKTFVGYDKYKILGVEEEFELSIDDWNFVGVIDLVFEDENGRLIIRDYKSKASFKNEEEQHKYARQLYLYALYVKEKYGRYPDELQFLMFRKKKDPVKIPFNEADAQEALEWAKDTVRIIRNAFDYPPQCEDFYGQNLCTHREYCPHKVKPKYKDYILYLKSYISNDRSINSYLRDFITTMHFLMNEGYVEKFKMNAIKVDDSPVATYTDDELRALLKKPNVKKCTFAEYRNWVMTNLFFSTGIRQRSALFLKVKDIDFDNQYLHVNVIKNRKPLLVPLSSTMTNILKEYLNHRQYKSTEDYLFCTGFGDQMTKGNSYHNLYYYNKSRGVETTGIHRYRHTFAKQWVLNGGNVVTLSKILGHSSLEITQNYLNLLTSDVSKEVEELNLIDKFSSKQKIKMNKNEKH